MSCRRSIVPWSIGPTEPDRMISVMQRQQVRYHIGVCLLHTPTVEMASGKGNEGDSSTCLDSAQYYRFLGNCRDLAWGLQEPGWLRSLLTSIRGLFRMSKAVSDSPSVLADDDFANAIFCIILLTGSSFIRAKCGSDWLRRVHS